MSPCGGGTSGIAGTGAAPAPGTSTGTGRGPPPTAGACATAPRDHQPLQVAAAIPAAAASTTAPNAYVFTDSAGQATLYLELYDGVSGELLARIIDAQEADDAGGSRLRTRASNKADADRMLNMWADRLGTYLQNARENAAPAAAPPAAPATN